MLNPWNPSALEPKTRRRQLWAPLRPHGALIAAVFGGLCCTLGCSLDDQRQLQQHDEPAGDTERPGVATAWFEVRGEGEDGSEYQLDQLQVVVENKNGTVILDDSVSVQGSLSESRFNLRLPIDDDYRMTVEGVGAGLVDLDGDGDEEPVQLGCRGRATFDMGPGENDPVPLSVVCRLPGGGLDTSNVGLVIDFEFGHYGECGLLTVIGGPLSLELNGVLMTLNAVSAPGTNLEWSVSPNNGTFGNKQAGTTTYDCHTAGPATISLTVTKPDDECEDVFDIDVSCGAGGTVCGNGIQEQGEACDGSDTPPDRECTPSCTLVECGDGEVEGSEACDDGGTIDGDDPNSDGIGCSADCSVVEECGDDVIQTGLGEQCEPPGSSVAGGTCNAQCRIVLTGGEDCGNNVLESGEECDGTDTPSGLECTNTCRLVECGDFSKEGSEGCDDGNTLAGDGCGSDCQIEALELTCEQCVSDRCSSQLTACDASANVVSGVNLCEAVIDCYGESECTEGQTTTTVICLCGTYDDFQCLTGYSDGACVPELKAAAGTNANNLDTLLRWDDASYAIGDANALADCMRLVGPTTCGDACTSSFY